MKEGFEKELIPQRTDTTELSVEAKVEIKLGNKLASTTVEKSYH